jgi:hypothetical protein
VRSFRTVEKVVILLLAPRARKNVNDNAVPHIYTLELARHAEQTPGPFRCVDEEKEHNHHFLLARWLRHEEVT